MRSAWVLATVLAACALFAVGIGCLGKPKFECAGAGDCLQDNVQGICQPDSFCSFPDSSCPITGQRYGDLSGPLANQCVGAPIDAPIDAYVHDAYVHDARECFGGSGAYSLCFTAMPPMGNIMLAGTLDTDNDARCMAPPANWMGAGQPDACLILGKSITVQTVAVTGTKALIILGDTISITGTLDIASHRGGSTGPAAPSATCANFLQQPGNNSNGGGGGAGGSFMRAGGNGASGDGTMGGVGGVAPPALGTAPTVLRGGCNGQDGALGQAGSGPAGKGGGTVFVTASKITFSGSGAINASGAGGSAGGATSGGSGGGSGGMIVLHAAETITGTTGAKVFANGGGASSGGGMGANGSPGSDPVVTVAVSTPAPGGTGGGGAGGDGYAGTTMAQAGSSQNNRGGGGGGGGGGYIQSNIALTNIASSPPVTIVP